MRAYEFIVEVDPIQIQQGPDISPELRRYKERGTIDTFMPDKREPGAQDILGPGQIRQMRAVQNVAPSTHFPKSGAAGSTYSPPKDDTTPVIPVSPKYVTTFEPLEKAQSNPLKVERIAAAIKAGKELPPIVVKPTDTGYQVVDGHHRLAAHQQAGSTTIPAKVIDPVNIKTINEPGTSWGYDKATKDFLKPGYGKQKEKTVSYKDWQKK
jgi:hypothetical protein